MEGKGSQHEGKILSNLVIKLGSVEVLLHRDGHIVPEHPDCDSRVLNKQDEGGAAGCP